MNYHYTNQKEKWTMVVVYKNNPDKEFYYVKSYNINSNSPQQWCFNKLKSDKILSATAVKGDLTAKKQNSIKPKQSLTHLGGFYYRDNEGYKYYINDGVKIKSKKPVY